MKTLTAILSTLTLTIGLTGAVNAATLEATDNSASTNICMKAAQGKKVALHHAIKESKLSKDYVVNKLSCNDLSITAFVAQHGSSPQKINKYLESYRHSGHVTIAKVSSL
ncbi:DUF3718 domain-containing protein [Psychrobium sp. 1_MG-2023]|uniref:DUF3718 domain-containing protein n=1 Tax=Psychrobium sp. 1_MG-2023 TaxID=3062624 RepID=UPI0026D10225|nr:DUF3718 domain-containing protein [Psychrobium sp. 1_MG-2023]MDP2561348.1 DUF3718 domain-containing protein [Psychrobium sp. 1_MG-2023]